MSVRVYVDTREGLTTIDYPDAERYEASDREVLTVCDSADRVLATFASGRWDRAEKLPEPEAPQRAEGGVAAPTLLSNGPEWREAFFPTDETATDALLYKLARIADDGHLSPREHQALKDAVRVAAQPGSALRDFAAKVHAAHAEPIAPAEAVLSEGTEPYVSVSVSANDADSLIRVIKEALRDGSLTIPAKALA